MRVVVNYLHILCFYASSTQDIVKNRNFYRLHKMTQRWRACVIKITSRRLFTIMILDPQTIYFHGMWVEISLVPGDTYFQNRLV